MKRTAKTAAFGVAWAAVFAFGMAPRIAQQPGLDTVRLKNGALLSGYIAAESKSQLTLKQLHDKPGLRPMLFVNVVDMDEAERIDKPPAADRRLVAQRLAEIEAQEKELAARQAAVPIAVGAAAAGGAAPRRFLGKGFVLESDLSEPLFRETAVRLEDLFRLLEAKLPPAREAPPLLIQIARSQAQLLEWQKRNHFAVHDLAFWDPRLGRLLAGTDMQRYADDFAKVQQDSAAKLARLDEHLDKLKRHFGGKPPLGGLMQVRMIRQQLQDFEVENQRNLDELKGRFMRAVAREAGRAWLSQRAAPEGVRPPRWLEEGLSQLVAAALPDYGPPRWGAVDAAALVAAQDALRKHQLWPLEKLLKASESELPSNLTAEQRLNSPGHLTAALLVQFLAAAEKLSGGAALHECLKQTQADGAGAAAFEKLAGQSLAECERGFRAWLEKQVPPAS